MSEMMTAADNICNEGHDDDDDADNDHDDNP